MRKPSLTIAWRHSHFFVLKLRSRVTSRSVNTCVPQAGGGKRGHANQTTSHSTQSAKRRYSFGGFFANVLAFPGAEKAVIDKTAKLLTTPGLTGTDVNTLKARLKERNAQQYDFLEAGSLYHDYFIAQCQQYREDALAQDPSNEAQAHATAAKMPPCVASGSNRDGGHLQTDMGPPPPPSAKAKSHSVQSPKHGTACKAIQSDAPIAVAAASANAPVPLVPPKQRSTLAAVQSVLKRRGVSHIAPSALPNFPVVQTISAAKVPPPPRSTRTPLEKPKAASPTTQGKQTRSEAIVVEDKGADEACQAQVPKQKAMPLPRARVTLQEGPGVAASSMTSAAELWTPLVHPWDSDPRAHSGVLKIPAPRVQGLQEFARNTLSMVAAVLEIGITLVSWRSGEGEVRVYYERRVNAPKVRPQTIEQFQGFRDL
eukprot:5249729-Amphidinium_carterae.2